MDFSGHSVSWSSVDLWMSRTHWLLVLWSWVQVPLIEARPTASKCPRVETEVSSVTDQGPVMVWRLAALSSMQPRLTHSPVPPVPPPPGVSACSLAAPRVLALASREVHHSVNPLP